MRCPALSSPISAQFTDSLLKSFILLIIRVRVCDFSGKTGRSFIIPRLASRQASHKAAIAHPEATARPVNLTHRNQAVMVIDFALQALWIFFVLPQKRLAARSFKDKLTARTNLNGRRHDNLLIAGTTPARPRG